MARLRSPNGCPWDRAQNHATLKPYLIEETYEVIDAIDNGNPDSLAEELGDLLLHIVFHARIAEEEGRFDMEDVCRRIADKLVERHPHVFKEQADLTPSEVVDRWEVIKANGRESYSVLEGVPRHLPALLKAYRIQEKVGRFGFDWDEAVDVVDKIREEISEFENAYRENDKQALHREFGDLLFSLVNFSRHLGIQAEAALDDADRRFIRRFQYIENKLTEAGKTLEEATLEEMDALWEEAKLK